MQWPRRACNHALLLVAVLALATIVTWGLGVASSPSELWNKCISAASQSPESPSPVVHRNKLRIAVVLASDLEFTKNAAKHSGEFSLTAWSCYCARHGYHFFYESLKYDQNGKYMENPRSGSTKQKGGSWSNMRILVTKKYLRFFDYVVQVSLDTYVANRSFKIEQFLEGDPDVVLSARSQQSEKNIDFIFPRGQFPKRPSGTITSWHCPQLHTETMIVKNSSHGHRFCDDMLKYAGWIVPVGVDMTAVQRAALEFVDPDRSDVKKLKELKEFGIRPCSYLKESYLSGEGVWGNTGPFCIPTNPKVILPIFYMVTTGFVASQRDLYGTKGHLRVLQEAEMARDWNFDKLMTGGDFLVHTKAVFCNHLTTKKGNNNTARRLKPVMRPPPCTNPPLVTEDDVYCGDAAVVHPEAFEPDLGKSVNLARQYGYNVTAVFAKSGVIV